MPKLSVVMVTFNRADLLDEALHALMELSEDFDIHLVNNASTDHTGQVIEKWRKQGSKELIVHTLEKNIGGAGGFSHGLAQAARAGSDLFWLMDDDTMVNGHSLDALLQAYEQYPDAAFYSSRALWIDGNDHRMNAQRLMEKDRGQDYLDIREATFVSFLVDRAHVEAVGLPIADFFIWGDDIEYTRRLSARQPGLLVRPSTVLHKTANNVGSDISRDDPQRLGRYFYAYRNEVFIARQEGLYRKARQLAKILYHSLRVMALSDHKARRLSMIWKSSAAGLSFQPRIEFLGEVSDREASR